MPIVAHRNYLVESGVAMDAERPPVRTLAIPTFEIRAGMRPVRDLAAPEMPSSGTKLR